MQDTIFFAFNGVDYTKTYFKHSDIMNGGELEITMGSKPGTIWGAGDANKAVSSLYLTV